MKFEIGLLLAVAAIWTALAAAYALAPWGDMIGYAWVWGFGAALFLGLALVLMRTGSRWSTTDH
ncbi:hypothetical protein [Cereibacter sediminicola]|uniref:hypothetical protein n=1 Tax=Cereibacter sediminicola TaxID=2584941 RepID=UPI0011A83B94|nr:hypothetical protein [Cereibacter sediminicola]